MKARQLTISLDDETTKMVEACAAWRGVSVERLAHAYILDWLDVDYPETQGRLTRRGIYRDDPIGLEPQTSQQTSPNWRDELGISRLQPPAE